jgi:DNA-binding CsgD family transcriptional regulator
MSVSSTDPATGLLDRRGERAAVDRVLDRARAGSSAVLVVRGEPGIGKTALLGYAAGRGLGFRVVRAWGVESEMELAFAGLHQLCGPMLGRLDQLPGPQRDALAVAFGMREGQAPDRFLVGLAVLSLLAATAEDQPLACLVDDAQWLDRASVQCLAFAARRLLAEPVALIVAVREPGDDHELAGLPGLTVTTLGHDDARALLATAIGGRLDARVADLIVAETRGNPLALLELPRGLAPAELAGGFGLPGAAPLTGRIEDSFARQLDALPDQTRRLLLLAAADPSGDRPLVWRAAGRLGIPAQAGAPAVEAGLVEFGTRVRFRHPLVRSAAYRSPSFSERRQMHAALAEATDPIADPDRRAWHRAQAAAGPDEEVAAELECSAGRAQARGGLAAAAAFLERSVLLTADPARHADRALAAAQASLQAGAFGKALDLLATAEAGPLDELQSARLDLLRGQIAFASGPGADAPALLLKAAKRLEPLNLDLARQTYLNAWVATPLAGRLEGAGDLMEVSRAVRALPPARSPRPADLLLDGLALLITDGPAAAAPVLRQAVTAFASGDISREEGLASGWLAAGVLWDDDAGRAIMDREVRLAREAGALDELPVNLIPLAMSATWRGDFAAAASLIAEGDAVCEVTGSRLAPYAAMFLAAMRGNQAELTSLAEATIAAAEAGGQGAAVTCAHWVAAILHNGLGRYADAFAAAGQAKADSHLYMSMWALPELIEAAVRNSNTEVAAGALERLAESTSVSGTDWALGVEARSRALLNKGEAADCLYREAIERLGHTRMRAELARAHLLYGEWLRRENRRTEAREQLRPAYQMLTAMGMEAFAERARRELLATGETVRKRTVETLTDLTAQEAQIAKLARDGRTNQEIAAQMFISPRTVEWHLGNVFTKLGIASRKDLR